MVFLDHPDLSPIQKGKQKAVSRYTSAKIDYKEEKLHIKVSVSSKPKYNHNIEKFLLFVYFVPFGIFAMKYIETKLAFIHTLKGIENEGEQ